VAVGGELAGEALAARFLSLDPKNARPPSFANPSARMTRARRVRVNRVCSIVRIASKLLQKASRARVAESSNIVGSCGSTCRRMWNRLIGHVKSKITRANQSGRTHYRMFSAVEKPH